MWALTLSLQDVLSLRRTCRVLYQYFSSELFLQRWLSARGIPLLDGSTWAATFMATAYLFVLSAAAFPPADDPKGSVRRLANDRINSGHVCHVRVVKQDDGLALVIKIQSSQSKSKSYSVRTNLRTLEQSDSCVMRALVQEGDVCGHAMAVRELLARLAFGYETVQFNNSPASVFPTTPNTISALVGNISSLGEAVDYDRLVLSNIKRRAVCSGTYVGTKHHYLAEVVQVGSLLVRAVPVVVLPRTAPKSLVKHWGCLQPSTKRSTRPAHVPQPLTSGPHTHATRQQAAALLVPQTLDQAERLKRVARKLQNKQWLYLCFFFLWFFDVEEEWW
jgi:hypothetical protein